MDSHYSTDSSGKVFRLSDLSGPFNNVSSCLYEFEHKGRTFKYSAGRQWKTTKPGLTRLAKADRVGPQAPSSTIDDCWMTFR